MIDWRIRGYVPDSDDEDDFQDLPAPQRRDEAEPAIDRLVKAASVDTKHEPQQGSSTTTSLDGGAGESTVTQLERTLSHGLQTIRDILTSTTPSSIQHDDVDDSPLSSPPKSLPNSPSAYNLFRCDLGRSENYDVTQFRLHDNEQYAPRRSLRARAPIQEHPYMLEDARYRQLMKGVGIKPINVPTVDRDIGVAHQDEDSQQSENLESYRPEESFDFQVPSSPLSLHSFPKGIESQKETTANDETALSDADNDLPNLTQILSERDRTAKRLYRSKDRSFRSAKNTTSMPLAPTKVSNKPANDSLRVIIPGLLSPNRDFQVPPSPPRSDDLLAFETSNVQERKRLSTRPGKGLNTPQALPTPLVSSDGYHRKRPLTVVSSSESSSSDEADSDLELTPQPEKDDSQGIQSIKQRLKGTLPASWVKIDMQNQGSNRPKHRSLPQPVNISNERGVARKVSGSRARGHEQIIGSSLPFGSAEDSDLDSEEAVHPIPQRRHDKTFAVVRPVVDADDVLDEDPMQGDEVEYALPQLTREAASTQRQRQSRLHDGWAVLSRRSAADTSAAGLSGRNCKGPAASSRKKVATTKRKKSKHKVVPPQMLMADAPGIRELDRKDQPQFLKLAARQARKVTWRPQRTVSRKIFLLASKDDTKDVIDQISVWQQRQNTGRRQQNPVAHSHVSTNTISDAASLSTTSNVNSAITKSKHQLRITEDIESLKRSTSALLATVSVQKSHRSSASVDADQVESVQPVIGDRATPRATQIKSLFAHRNRSGPGQLLNRVPEPRIAQIESSQRSDIHGVNLPFRNVVTLKRQPQRRSLIATKEMSPVITESVSVQTAKPRQPRKRVPRMSAIPTARMEHEDVFDISTLPSHPETATHQQTIHKQTSVSESTAYWSESAIYSVKTLDLEPSCCEFEMGDIASVPLPIAGGALKEFTRMVYDDDFRPEDETVQRHPIYLPRSDQKIGTMLYGAVMEETVSLALDEIQLILFTPEEVPRSFQEYEKCLLSLSTVVTYIGGEELYHDLSIDMGKRCTGFCLRRIDEFLSSFAPRDLLWSEQKRSVVLRCLNWLMILLLSTHQSSCSGQDEICETRNVCHRIVGRCFEIVLEPEHLLSALRELRSPGRGLKIGESFVEAETIVIAWHTCRFLDTDFDEKLFYEIFTKSLANVAPSDWEGHLAFSLLALCLVLPLKYVCPNGGIQEYRDRSDRSSSLFNLLANFLSNIIAKVPSGCVTPSGGQLIEAIEELCLKTVKELKFKNWSTLVTTLLQAYSWNAMLPFSTVPSVDEVFSNHDCLLRRHETCQTNDFCKFLELVEICIDVSSHGMVNLGRSANEVRGLIFSLIPNNARIVDAQEQLEVTQYLALRNHFALYITLFIKAPDGFQPRIEQLQRQVDFSKSHASICGLAIVTWKAITLDYLRRPDPGYGNLKASSKWMNMMLRQSVSCFEDHQQFSALSLIEDLLDSLTEVISSCRSEVKARQLLTGDTFDTITDLLDKPNTLRNNERVVVAGLKTLYAYVQELANGTLEETLINEVQLVLKKVIQHTLSNGTASNKDLIRHIMAPWFLVARNMVRSFHRHWNDFVEPHSTLSIDFISGLRNSLAAYEAKECFFSDLIKTDPSFFFLEARPIVFMTWVSTLLLPVQSMRFEHVLTNAILKHEKDSLTIKDLATRLFEHDNDRELTLQDVVNSRIVILRHIIQNIYGQQSDPEEEWLAGGLDAKAQTDLLRTMTKAMKANWLDLKDMPAAQADYTNLVHAILNEMETYPITGFKIDSWFSGASEFPRPVQTLDNIFKCRYGETRDDITKEAIRNFRLVYIQEMDGERETRMLQELLRVFHCTDSLRARKIDGSIKYSIDIIKQARFMQIVFPAFIECGCDSLNSSIMDIILDLITQLAERLPFRVDNLNADHMQYYVKTTAALLCAVRTALEATQFRHQAKVAMIRYIRVAVASIFSLVDAGLEIDETHLEICLNNALSIYKPIQDKLKVNQKVSERMVRMDNYSDPSPFADEDTVYGEWTTAPIENWNLVPEELVWMLYFDPAEPELTEEEQSLRDYARDELKGWKGYLSGRSWKELNEKEEMLGFLELLRARDLIYRQDGDDDSCFDDGDSEDEAE